MSVTLNGIITANMETKDYLAQKAIEAALQNNWEEAVKIVAADKTNEVIIFFMSLKIKDG